jgi:hypothetical protein
MVNEGFNKVPGRAAEVCHKATLGDEARALLQPEMTARQFLELLVAQEHLADGVRFLAHALPKREAVWWACQCTRLVLGPSPPEPAGAALQAAERWAAAPTDENRRSAFPAAEAADVGTPAGCAAVAAFLSGGSLAPPNLPEVPPGEHLTGQLVANGVLLAAVQSEPEKAAEKYRRFIALGLEVVEGKSRWAQERPAAPASSRPTTRPPGGRR